MCGDQWSKPDVSTVLHPLQVSCSRIIRQKGREATVYALWFRWFFRSSSLGAELTLQTRETTFWLYVFSHFFPQMRVPS